MLVLLGNFILFILHGGSDSASYRHIDFIIVLITLSLTQAP